MYFAFYAVDYKTTSCDLLIDCDGDCILHVHTEFRTDWSSGSCTLTGARKGKSLASENVFRVLRNGLQDN